MDLFCLAALPNKGEMRVGPMQTCWGQNFCHACNIMELFHAIDLLTCQPSLIWNSFQAITHLTNLPCYYLLYISRLLQGCIFHAVSWLRQASFPGRFLITRNHYAMFSFLTEEC